MDKYCNTQGNVVGVKMCWYIVNTKHIRTNSFDGAVFSDIIIVKYTINGTEYTKKKHVSYRTPYSDINSGVSVRYKTDKLRKSVIDL